MEEVLHNVDYNFDLIVLTETWRTDKNYLEQDFYLDMKNMKL